MAEEPREFTYSATADSVAYARVSKRSFRREWKSIVRGWLQVLLLLLVVSVIGYSFGANASGMSFDGRGALGASCSGLLAVVIWIPVSLDASIRGQVKAMSGKRWECRITETEYVYRDAAGISVSIPFERMQIVIEDEDAWLVSFAQSRLVVFRKSLREAGLDEVFAQRLARAGQS